VLRWGCPWGGCPCCPLRAPVRPGAAWVRGWVGVSLRVALWALWAVVLLVAPRHPPATERVTTDG